MLGTFVAFVIRAVSPIEASVPPLAVLMALAVGEFSMEDLTDIAAAGLLHDIGLKDTAKFLSNSHTRGIRKVAETEKVIYMRHIGFTIDRIKREKIPITPGVLRIIELHHENWDGSGFKGYPAYKIYRAARVLRIADDFVSLLQDRNLELNYYAAIDLLMTQTGMYDPVMLEILKKR